MDQKAVKLNCIGMHFQINSEGELITVPYPDLKSVPEHKLENGSYLCHICNNTYVKKSYYKQHVMSHMNKYECEICKNKFTHRNHLNQHMTTHQNPNSHSCIVCDKKFTFKFNLKTHMKIHIKYYDKDGNIKYL